MGYSFRVEAGRVERAWQDGCHKQTGSSNAFVVNGERYFYEVSRRDQSDGGICGTIHRQVPPPAGATGDYYRKSGTFKIDGNGFIVRAPKKLKEFAAQVVAEMEKEREQQRHSPYVTRVAY